MSDEAGVWRTISGRKVFIKFGQTVTEAMRESGKFKDLKPEAKEIMKEEFETFAKDWAEGEYYDYALYSQYLVNGTMKHDKEFYEENLLPNVDPFMRQTTEDVINYLNKQEDYTENLYRIEASFRKDLKVGDEVRYGITSTTRDPSLMDRTLSGEDEGLASFADKEMTMFVFEGSHKAVDIAEQSPYNQSESLLTGNYKISREEYIKKPKLERYSLAEYMKKFPNDYEVYTSKKGREMIKVKSNNKTYVVGSSSTLTQDGDGYNQAVEKYSNFVEKRVIYLERKK